MILLTALLLALATSVLAVWYDARRLGHDPLLASAFAMLCWPLGLGFWIMVRRPHQLAPPGMGTPWG